MKDINKKTNKSIVGNSATIGWHVWWQGGINLTHYKKYCQISATIATLFFYMVAELRLYFIRFICCSATLPPCFYLNNNNNKNNHTPAAVDSSLLSCRIPGRTCWWTW